MKVQTLRLADIEICPRCNIEVTLENGYWSKLGEVICTDCGIIESYGFWRSVDEHGKFPTDIQEQFEEAQIQLRGKIVEDLTTPRE